MTTTHWIQSKSKVLLIGSMIPALFLLSSQLIGCGEEEVADSWTVTEGEGGDTRYDDGTSTVVVVGDDDRTWVVGGSGENCVKLDNVCIDLNDAKGRYCQDGAQADVIVVDGEVVDVICYPPRDNASDIAEVERDADGNASVPQQQSGSVVTFSEDTDGEAIEGDIHIDAERTTIYGNGVDNTIIDGNVTVASNNSRIRAVTITGDVQYTSNSNNSTLTFCKVHGNLNVIANGFSSVSCQIFGDVTVTGNGATLVNIGVGGEWNVTSSATCAGCYSFADEDEDHIVHEDERGDELLCD